MAVYVVSIIFREMALQCDEEHMVFDIYEIMCDILIYIFSYHKNKDLSFYNLIIKILNIRMLMYICY